MFLAILWSQSTRWLEQLKSPIDDKSFLVLHWEHALQGRTNWNNCSITWTKKDILRSAVTQRLKAAFKIYSRAGRNGVAILWLEVGGAGQTSVYLQTFFTQPIDSIRINNIPSSTINHTTDRMPIANARNLLSNSKFPNLGKVKKGEINHFRGTGTSVLFWTGSVKVNSEKQYP